MMLARLMESSDFMSTCAGLAWWVESSTLEQWLLFALLALERVAQTPASPALTQKLVNLVPVLLCSCPTLSFERVSLCAGPLRIATGCPKVFCFSQTQSPLVSTARSYGTPLPTLMPQFGTVIPHSSGGNSAAEISLLFLNCHTMNVGPAASISPPSYQSQCGFFLHPWL